MHYLHALRSFRRKWCWQCMHYGPSGGSGIGNALPCPSRQVMNRDAMISMYWIMAVWPLSNHIILYLQFVDVTKCYWLFIAWTSELLDRALQELIWCPEYWNLSTGTHKHVTQTSHQMLLFFYSVNIRTIHEIYYKFYPARY